MESSHSVLHAFFYSRGEHVLFGLQPILGNIYATTATNKQKLFVGECLNGIYKWSMPSSSWSKFGVKCDRSLQAVSSISVRWVLSLNGLMRECLVAVVFTWSSRPQIARWVFALWYLFGLLNFGLTSTVFLYGWHINHNLSSHTSAILADNLEYGYSKANNYDLSLNSFLRDHAQHY